MTRRTIWATTIAVLSLLLFSASATAAHPRCHPTRQHHRCHRHAAHKKTSPSARPADTPALTGREEEWATNELCPGLSEHECEDVLAQNEREVREEEAQPAEEGCEWVTGDAVGEAACARATEEEGIPFVTEAEERVLVVAG